MSSRRRLAPPADSLKTSAQSYFHHRISNIKYSIDYTIYDFGFFVKKSLFDFIRFLHIFFAGKILDDPLRAAGICGNIVPTFKDISQPVRI